MTPEVEARVAIDQKLTDAGWVIQDVKRINLGVAIGVAVREYPTDTGPADYVLFVERCAVGIIEAKRDSAGESLTANEHQTERYAHAKLKWRKDAEPLPFLFEATGKIIRFTDSRDPVPRSREIFHFFLPSTLAAWVAQPKTLRGRLIELMPPLRQENLRSCQITAVLGLEESLARNRPRALVHMATGAGKTFTSITSVYRLLKFGGAKRVLFLVDTKNLGQQAHQEFMAYTPPDDARKFTELYNVQRLTSSVIDPHAQVCISTIQRMYSLLSGVSIDDSVEEIPLSEISPILKQSKEVFYVPSIPVETFDFIIIDECHRSIYNLWKRVLDYFDAFLIGLTATPDKRTFGFFDENIVAEYTYEESVADGVNVGYDVYVIETEITKKGALLEAKEWIDHRDRKTRAKRWAETEEDVIYEGKELDRLVVNPSQIRQVITAMKKAVETCIFPNRKEVPKTLIFAKTDSHADDIVKIVREVYEQSNAFCKKVTYRTKENADSILASFRNEYYPRIAVTVDMIATGTDVKPLEILLFMRDVRSRGYYEQMKGRGVRSLNAESLQRVTASAKGAKDRFVLIDAVGVEKSHKTESRSLEKRPGITLRELLQCVAAGERDDESILSLANRLIRLAKQIDTKAHNRILAMSDGVTLNELSKGLITAVNPDRIAKTALDLARSNGREIIEEELTADELRVARHTNISTACSLFDKPELRDVIESARRDFEQLIDQINIDEISYSGFSDHADILAVQTIGRFEEYIAQHRDEISALSFFYKQPYDRRELTFQMLEELHAMLSSPPLMLTTDRLWESYARVNESQVKGAGGRTQLTDLVSLIRFAIGLDVDLRPFSERVDKNFQSWIFRHNAQRATAFTVEQTEWLRAMKDHISGSCTISRDDFDYAELASKGGLQKAWAVLGKELDQLIFELNEELVA